MSDALNRKKNEPIGVYPLQTSIDTTHMITIKRVYEKPARNDGYRVLVDRLWPRGISKEKARVDLWVKDTAPSDELRHWFSHDPEKWTEFQRKYRHELYRKLEMLKALHTLERQKRQLTLLYAARDQRRNNAVVLKDVLQR